MGSDINNSKLVGGKRKNGHKSNCTCHICENMKNKAKRGGYEEEVEKEKENMMGGSKKKNGHRKACKCPICKNMKNSKKRGGAKSKRTKKIRGGDDEEDSEDKEVDKELDDETESDTDSDTDTDSSDEEEEEGEEEGEQDEENKEEDKMGGRRKKRSNGHKSNCKYPICKNMRKKKGGDPNDQQPDEKNQMGDIEEAGVKATSGSDLLVNETKASTSDYDALDSAEKGEAGQNVVGGTRKRRRGGKKWGGKKRGGKTRKSRRSRRRH